MWVVIAFDGRHGSDLHHRIGQILGEMGVGRRAKDWQQDDKRFGGTVISFAATPRVGCYSLSRESRPTVECAAKGDIGW